MNYWSYTFFALSWFINFIVISFYPFSDSMTVTGPRASGLIWAFLLVSAAIGKVVSPLALASICTLVQPTAI